MVFYNCDNAFTNNFPDSAVGISIYVDTYFELICFKGLLAFMSFAFVTDFLVFYSITFICFDVLLHPLVDLLASSDVSDPTFSN